MQPLTRQQVRAVDRLAIEELGIPGVVLMENAGRSAAEAILNLLRQRKTSAPRAKVGILCGGGNNGGDGYVIARHLHNHGHAVTIFAAVAPENLKGDAAIHAAIVRNMALTIHVIRDEIQAIALATEWPAMDLLVDALLGTGFTGDSVRPPLAPMIRQANAARERGVAVVAVDLPSGLDADTGQAAAPTLRADLTVTFVAPKIGFAHAAEWLGQVNVADIGIPPELIPRVAGESTSKSPP